MRLIDADALIQSLEKKHAHWHELVPEENKEIEFAHSYALNVIRNAPTAEAKPTVIRSKTLFPTKDFMEWAKRIKEVNPNAVVIPCDAEVASAEAVSREEYEETDGVITIEKQSAKDVGEIKHIVISSPNYTRYFYNESMPTSAEVAQGEWVECLAYNPDLDEDVLYIECDQCGHRPYFSGTYRPKYCEACGSIMKGADDE